jgi:hypothetical protein
MNAIEYIQVINLQQVESGKTLTEFEIGEIFGLKLEDFKDLESFNIEVANRSKIGEEYKLDKTFIFNNKEWYYDEDFTQSNILQWAKLHELLNASDGLMDINFISIYCRPVGEVFNINKLDEITNELYNLPVEIFLALNSFFFQSATKLSRYIGIQYLNQINQQKKTRKKIKFLNFGILTRGLLYVKGWLRKILFSFKKFIK